MMNSSFDNNDDDEFAPNPFRSSSSQQQQQPQISVPASSNIMVNQPLNQPDPYSGMTGSFTPQQPVQQQPMQGQMQQQPGMMMQAGQMQQGMPMQGQMQQSMQQQQPAATDTASWTGAMDQRAAPVESYGASGTSSALGPGEVPSTPFSLFSWRGCMACCRLDSYGQYFDMDTVDILSRLKASLTKFWQPDQFRTAVLGDVPTEDLGLKGPDLYGPVWVAATLVFLIGVTSNMHDYYKHKKNQQQQQEEAETVDEEFEVDIHHLLKASGIVFTFVFGMSTALWLASNCMGMPGISWAMWTCVYGYAQTPYLLSTLLVTAFLPFLPLASLIILIVATVVSGLLILRNLSTPLMAQDSSATHKKASPMILCILGGHVFYLIALKWCFYS